MLTLYPYLIGSTWVFDDERTGLKEEAFVLGMSEMISRSLKRNTFPMLLKDLQCRLAIRPFDGFDVELTWLRSDDSQVVPGQDGSASQYLGNWYTGIVADLKMEGWLCPCVGFVFRFVTKNDLRSRRTIASRE